MAVSNEDFNCRECGQPLEWEDTMDTSGGINEGYISERQLWTCNHCQKDYIIEQKVCLTDNDVDIIDFEEA